jgi:Restriction endonuclease
VSYFAIGILSDVRPLAEYAVDAEKFDLAARCVWQGRTTNAALTDFVVGHFRRAVGEPFLPILLRNVTWKDTPSETADNEEVQKADRARRPVATTSEYLPPNQQQSDGRPEHAGPPILDKFEMLLDFLDSINNFGLPNHIRGSAFERFTADLFGNVFKVVKRDYRTENGEIDLILDIADAGPWWLEYGGDALVECKNLKSGMPLSEVSAFLNKVSQLRVKLGFIVSMSGFTQDAERTIRNRSSNVTAPLVVPLDADRIRTALQQGHKLDDFFREVVREIKYVSY